MNTYVYLSDDSIFTLDAAFWLCMGVIDHVIRNGIQHPFPPGPHGGGGGPRRCERPLPPGPLGLVSEMVSQMVSEMVSQMVSQIITHGIPNGIPIGIPTG